MEESSVFKEFNDDTGKFQNSNFDSHFMTAIREIYLAIQEAGYAPYDQLIGYIRTGNDQYITRRRNARKMIAKMDPQMISQYLKHIPTSM